MKKLIFGLIALAGAAVAAQAQSLGPTMPDTPDPPEAESPEEENPGMGGPAGSMGMVSEITNDFKEVVTKRVGRFTIDVATGGYGYGFVGCLDQPQGMSMSMGRSFEFSMLEILGVKVARGINSLECGFGMTWRNYKGTDAQWVKADGQMGLVPFPEGTTHRWSRIKTFSLNIPLLYTVRAGGHVDFTLGPVFGFTTHSSYNTGFTTTDGRTVKLSDGNVYPRLFTVDALAVVSYDKVGVYCRYAPMHPLRDGCGPQFSSISVGLMFGF